MKEATKATWVARVEEWKRSGKTAKEFAQGQSFSSGTLTWRACQLRREGGSTRTIRRGRQRKAHSKIVLAEVVQRAPASRERTVTLEVGSVRISVGAGFDKVLLREVVVALQGGRS